MAGFNRPYRWWNVLLTPLAVTDMNEQPIIKPFHQDSLRDPAPGSVSVDSWDPVPTKFDLLTAPDQHADFKNPVSADEDSVAQGKALYSIYCTHCHGPDMTPDPNLWPPVKVGKLPGETEIRWSMPAADINLVKNYTDEHIFAVITHGSGAIMKRMSYHLDPEERWHIVNYIRSIENQ